MAEFIETIFIIAGLGFMWWLGFKTGQLKEHQDICGNQKIINLPVDSQIVIGEKDLERLLDRNGLIAMPKGADFTMKERQSRGEGA